MSEGQRSQRHSGKAFMMAEDSVDKEEQREKEEEEEEEEEASVL